MSGAAHLAGKGKLAFLFIAALGIVLFQVCGFVRFFFFDRYTAAIVANVSLFSP